MDKILIAIPTDDRLYVETHISLRHLKKPENTLTSESIMQSSLLHAGRNELALQAVKANCSHLLFVDSDMVFNENALQQIYKHKDCDIVSGLYFQRRGDNMPVIYKDIKPRSLFRKNAEMTHVTDIDRDFFEIDACGLGFCLIKVDVFATLYMNYHDIFEPFKGMGEDISFCYRAKKCGFKVYCDTTFPLGHIGTKIYTKKDYLCQNS